MIRRPPRSTRKESSAASDVYKRQIQVYAEHLKQLKLYFNKLKDIPGVKDYDSLKVEAANKVTAAYDQLIVQLGKHKELQIKKLMDAIDKAKSKRQKTEGDVKILQDSIDGLLKALNILKKYNVSKIQQNHLLKYNNFERVKHHENCIEEIKGEIDKLDRLRDKYMNFAFIDIKIQAKDAYLSRIIQIPLSFDDEQRLLLIEPRSRKIIVTNLERMKKRLVVLNSKTFKFPEHFEFLEIGNKLIVCGGSDEMNRCVPNTYRIALESKEVRDLPSMEIAKKYHALVALTKQVIYSIGGLGGAGAVKTCEWLNLKESQWCLQCPLNEAREGPAVCAIGGKYLYCIGGRGKDEELFSTIEFLDISFPKLGWTLIELENTVWKPIYFGLAVPIDNKHILISGGMGADQVSVAESYIFNVETNQFEYKNKMVAADCFLERDKRMVKGKIYAIGYVSYAIHIYDIEKREWNIIKSTMTNAVEDNKSSN
eukprot:TRINITY_DN6258_c0_g1_i6.p1 TRINITY_DN6258_c0_g1~~TRINITY_DN6258_c0_g1_i6.p1  ORF type:complete len:489 (+),score=125.20 TRINITY_DN6258_c0_g1_i6:23-1468(+)